MGAFADWASAWQAKMAESSYPHATLWPVYENLPGLWSYSWHPDPDQYIEFTHACESGDESEIERCKMLSRAAWLVAHDTFVAVDHLRPAFVVASPKLLELLEARRENK